MSCENNTNSVSRAAGQTAGLPHTASKSGFVVGRMVYNLNPARRFGTTANSLINTAMTVGKVANEINPVNVVGKSFYRTAANSARTAGYVGQVMRELHMGEAALKAGKIAQEVNPVIMVEKSLYRTVTNSVKTLGYAGQAMGELEGVGEAAARAGVAALHETENLAGTGSAFVGYTMGAVGPEEPSSGLSLSRTLGKLRDLAESEPGQFLIGKLIPHLGLPLAIGRIGRKVLSLGVSRLVRLSKTRDLGTTTQGKRLLFFFKRNIAVNLWGSSLTPTLNRMDLIGSSFKVVSNKGAMFKLDRFGDTWHNGVTTIRVNGQTRVISHLQNLTYPANHYYFNRQLSNKEAVGVASGQIKPQTVPGYVGYVSPLEGLMPTWLNAKQSLIKSYLAYGPAGKKA